MRQIDSLAILSSGKGNCKEVECPKFQQVKKGKSTSTTVRKIYISTVFYHYFLHSTMIFSHFSTSTLTFTFYISTTFLSSFLHSTSSKRAKSTIYSNPTPPFITGGRGGKLYPLKSITRYLNGLLVKTIVK